MLHRKIFLVLFMGFLCTAAQADIYIFNTLDERLTYEVTLPNGDTKKGDIKENTGYYPAQTSFKSERGQIVNFRVTSETGRSHLDVKGAYSQCFLIGKKNGKLLFKPVSWYLSNGQSHKRMMTIYNATGKPVQFKLIDEKEMRDISLGPGEETTVSSKNGFNGSSGFHHLKFPDGHRLDRAIQSGYFSILYMDKRSPGKIQADGYGHITIPKGITAP